MLCLQWFVVKYILIIFIYSYFWDHACLCSCIIKLLSSESCFGGRKMRKKRIKGGKEKREKQRNLDKLPGEHNYFQRCLRCQMPSMSVKESCWKTKCRIMPFKQDSYSNVRLVWERLTFRGTFFCCEPFTRLIFFHILLIIGILRYIEYIWPGKTRFSATL